MLSGMLKAPPVWCPPAPSWITTTWEPPATRALISFQCSFIASALTAGMIIAAPTARARPIARTNCAEDRWLSTTISGRDPIFAQILDPSRKRIHTIRRMPISPHEEADR